MNFDIIVIGAGPGGYVAAIRAAQLGKKVAVVEKEHLGGVCLNWGCIPTKALLKSAQVYDYINHAEDYGITVGNSKADISAIVDRSRGVAEGMSKGIAFLFKKNKITILDGFGKLSRGKKVVVTNSIGKKQEYTADQIILATGGRAKALPHIPIDGKKIISYKEALVLREIPKSMIVMGAGAIGVEFAYYFNALGTDVTVVEFMKQGLLPREDVDVSRELKRAFKKAGIKIMGNSAVEKVETKGKSCKVFIKNRKTEILEKLNVDIVLSATGVLPNIENIGIEALGIKIENGFIAVDDFYETSVKGIYAIGDIVAGPALAHTASAEGIICVEKIAGVNPSPLDYSNIPSCTYCTPEVASVGMTEVEAKEAGYKLKVGKFPFSASGKASAAGTKEGFVKLIFDEKYGELLGAHMIGANVTDMIAEIVVARNLEATGHELIKSVHPHPTMSEAIMEAAAAAYDEVIHL